MNKRVQLLLHILLLVLSLSVYFWSDRKAMDIHGPTCMVSGPDNTIFILVEDQIIKVKEDGSIRSTLSLKDMSITEPIADLFIQPDGEMLIGLAGSQLIQRRAADGKLLGTLSRPPSPPVPDGEYFKFTKNPRSGMLYVADSGHHRIQIYGADEKARNVLTSYGQAPNHDASSDESADEDGLDVSTPITQFRFPNGIAIDNDRLFVADTHNQQIVQFDLEGHYQKTFPTVYSRRTDYRYPTQFSIGNDTLYVINRGHHYVGGEVVAIPLNGPRGKTFIPKNAAIDPFFVLARDDDVLVADNNSKKILRYYPDGVYAGYFGRDDLQAVLSKKFRSDVVFSVIKVYSVTGMISVLGGLLLLKRRDRVTREQLGMLSAHQPVKSLQRLLGPEGGRRRELLQIFVPGLGYMAAGRPLRAIILLPVLLFCIVAFLICLVGLFLYGVIFLWPTMATGLIAAAVWAGIVIDGKRLNESGEQLPRKFDPLAVITTFAVPLVTAASGIALQLARERFILHDNPGIALAIQRFFQKVLIALHYSDSGSIVFAAMEPAMLFFGWGGASSALFGVMAWKFRKNPDNVALAALVGFVVGAISWVLTGTFPANMLGGAYYAPLSQGLLVSTAVYVYFRKSVGSALIIPAGIVGAWIGSTFHLFFRFPLPFTNPGASTRATKVAFEAYFIHLAILIALNVLERRKQKDAGAIAVSAISDL